MERNGKVKEMQVVDMTNKGVQYSDTQVMSVADWLAVEDNPRQRDTERHAKVAKRKHLKDYHPAQMRTQMAVTKDGHKYKLDGHTRAYLWATGELPAPDKVVVDVWECDSVDYVKDLYTTFDNKNAAEDVVDRLTGALREYGYDPHTDFSSPALKDKQFGNSVCRAYGVLHGGQATNDNVYEKVGYFLPELKLLDKCGGAKHKYPGAVKFCAILTFRRWGPEVFDFWYYYANDMGEKTRDWMDPVYAFSSRVTQFKVDGISLSSSSAHYKLLGYAIAAIRTWQDGRAYSAQYGLRSVSRETKQEFLRKALNTRRTWE